MEWAPRTIGSSNGDLQSVAPSLWHVPTLCAKTRHKSSCVTCEQFTRHSPKQFTIRKTLLHMRFLKKISSIITGLKHKINSCFCWLVNRRGGERYKGPCYFNKMVQRQCVWETQPRSLDSLLMFAESKCRRGARQWGLSWGPRHRRLSGHSFGGSGTHSLVGEFP